MNYGFTLIAAALLLSSGSLALAEGTGNSGGGEGVVFPDGSVRLVDLLHPASLPANPVSEEFIRSEFFPDSNRYVKAMGASDAHFFDCATEKFLSSQSPQLKNFAPFLKNSPVVQVEGRILRWMKSDETPDAVSPSFASVSKSIPAVYQEPLAAFNMGMLWISHRFAARLNETDACALAVHEGLRLYNYTVKMAKPLSTSQIEETTREIMAGSPITASLNSDIDQMLQEDHDGLIKTRNEMIAKWNQNSVAQKVPGAQTKYDEYLKTDLTSHDASTRLYELSMILIDASEKRYDNALSEMTDSISLCEMATQNTWTLNVEAGLVGRLGMSIRSSVGRMSDFLHSSAEDFLWIAKFDQAVVTPLPGRKTWDTYELKITRKQSR